ncbi:MAG TPA: hypothetical protein VN634_03815 [Candidatus Limnocylindrales bacterium]|nr:hypothetical protein [Candidatus Limnocylindrales bacterium]
MKSRSRPDPSVLISLFTCLVTCTAFASPAARAFAAVRVAADAPTTGIAEGNLQLAGRRAAKEGKAPERGSSASLYGGTSADRYGGNSADRGGIAGERDSRVYRKPARHDEDNAPRRKVEDDQDQDKEEE